MRAAVLTVLALLAGCRSDAAPASAPTSPEPELVAIDLFGTRQITREQLLAARGPALRDFASVMMSGGDPSLELIDQLHQLGDFAYAQPALVGYYQPGGMKYYLTVDFVDRADAARRMPFLPAPEGSYPDPAGLLADWRAYDAKIDQLQADRRMSPKRTECPAFHCLGDHAHPEVAALAARFVARVPVHVDELATILRDDADPRRRAAAAYLLAYAPDGPAVVDAMLGSFRDGEELVRNNAMRVISDIAFHHPELEVPLDPVLDALDYPATLDRNKASAILAGLLARPGAARRDAAQVRRAIPTLLAMLRLEQPNNHDFAYDILKAISGKRFGERDHAAWQAWFEAL